jgi:rhodanese-related sulfurtransferase
MSLRLPWWLPFGKVEEIGPGELKRWLDEGRCVQLVDSRTALEYGQGTIASAQHAPVTGLPGAINRLRLEKDCPVVLVCLSGHRSRPGTRLLRSRGYQAFSLKGGVLAWRAAGYEVNPSSAP